MECAGWRALYFLWFRSYMPGLVDLLLVEFLLFIFASLVGGLACRNPCVPSVSVRAETLLYSDRYSSSSCPTN